MSEMRLLDLGCGAGDLVRWCLEMKGAATAVGVDASSVMLAACPAHPRAKWMTARMEQVAFPAASFEWVVSTMALHYVEDYLGLLAKIYEWLVPGGTLVFSVEHPLRFANSTDDWLRDAEGRKRAWPVDKYLEEGPIVDQNGDLVLVKWHRTLATWINGLVSQGFMIQRVLEPAAIPAAYDLAPDLAAANWKRPSVLVIRAEKAVT